MSDQHALVEKHFAALFSEADAEGVPADVVGRAVLARLVQVWSRDRDWRDIASELRFTADSLDPETDFEFVRP